MVAGTPVALEVDEDRVGGTARVTDAVRVTARLPPLPPRVTRGEERVLLGRVPNELRPLGGRVREPSVLADPERRAKAGRERLEVVEDALDREIADRLAVVVTTLVSVVKPNGTGSP